MSAFHRMVTYLHLYDHNIKGRNIGFAKIEKQNGKCRIEIHMKNTGYSISPIPVYFYTQNQQRFHGILLGDMELARGNGDFKAILTDEDWAENGYSLENVKGIFIPISEEIMLVSQWDNAPFVRDKFIEPPTPTNTPSQADTHPQQINTKSIPFQKTENTQQHDSPKNSISAANTAQNTENTHQHNDLLDSNSAEHTEQNTENAQQQHSLPASTPAEHTALNMENAQQQHTLQDSSPADNIAQNTENQQQQHSLPASTPAEHTALNMENAQQQHTLQDSSPADNIAQNTENQQQHFHQAGTPQNSLKATEAAPRRRQAVYRNPFALPRFPLWQQDFKQRQRLQGKAPNTSNQSTKTDKISPETASYNAKIPPNTANYNAKTPSNIAGHKTQTSHDTSGQAMDPSSTEPSPPPDEDWSMKWQMLLENYPVMTPFAGDEKTLCIRLDLKDLRLLPQKYWYLGNNSFLLHGFFNYRYLILGMTEKSGQKKWFLGIPGIFQNPERVMATLFGFPGFRNEKSASINTGEFGYWYRYLEE